MSAVGIQNHGGIEVTIQSQPQGQGKAALLSPAHVSAVMESNCLVTIGYDPIFTVRTVLKGQPTVNVGMVYTTTISDDLEVWWCENWKMLWNNKTKVLWPEESV